METGERRQENGDRRTETGERKQENGDGEQEKEPGKQERVKGILEELRLIKFHHRNIFTFPEFPYFILSSFFRFLVSALCIQIITNFKSKIEYE
jgi:hypothetical protein